VAVPLDQEPPRALQAVEQSCWLQLGEGLGVAWRMPVELAETFSPPTDEVVETDRLLPLETVELDGGEEPHLQAS